MSVLSEMIKSDKKRVGFDLWVGGLAWYDSWFGSKGSRVQISSGPPYLIRISNQHPVRRFSNLYGSEALVADLI